MVDFVVDKGLNVLLAQINVMAPNRSKKSDGSVGDPAHAGRKSDHNPQKTRDSSDGNDPNNQVDARDFTHDPAHGADIGEIFEAIRLSRDRRVLYAIFDGRIFSSYSTSTRKAWEWGPYSGEDDHSGHGHLSVVDAPNDYTALWSITMALTRDDIENIADAVWARFLGSSGPTAAVAQQDSYKGIQVLLDRPVVVPAPVDAALIRKAVTDAMNTPEVKATIKSVMLDPEVRAALD